MKTLRTENSGRKRTAASLACESLEGRKLMTGMAGAAGSMMGPGATQMASMGVGGFRHGDLHQFANASNQPGQPGPMGSFGPSVGFSGRQSMADGLDGGFEGYSVDANSSSGKRDVAQFGAGDPTKAAHANPQLATDLAKLRTDQQAIHDKSQVTPALLSTVRKDLQAIDAAKTGTADATVLKTLQTDRQAIFAGQAPPTDAQRTQLQVDQDAVLKNQGVSQTLIDQLATDRLAVKTASNVTAADQATLDGDLAAIKKDRPAPPSTPSGTDLSSTTAPSTWNMTTATDASTLNSTTPSSTTPDPAALPTATNVDPTMTQVHSTAIATTLMPMGAPSISANHGRPGMIPQGGFGHQFSRPMNVQAQLHRGSKV